MRDILQMVILGNGQVLADSVRCSCTWQTFQDSFIDTLPCRFGQASVSFGILNLSVCLFVLVCLLSCSQVWLSLLVYDLTRLG
jgi:hypothetical protein